MVCCTEMCEPVWLSWPLERAVQPPRGRSRHHGSGYGERAAGNGDHREQGRLLTFRAVRGSGVRAGRGAQEAARGRLEPGPARVLTRVW
jgi:hypothetical protein